ncbi:uncharacterized protein RAG0_05381 [Rhynchosporium agropyri]|uniref:Globin-sensor domain-containing protein n=1 Tax=Rhynchosporium agropyri TaxID=914238 RepID=A0A1E1KD15_9HELO|nr:uncharacterized protein RAG0_05381 [Rhynchosporium agropyri]
MGLLLGYVIDIVIGAVINMDAIDNEMKCKVMRALNKVIWIQNDLMARHYLVESDDGNTEVEMVTPPLSDAEGEHFSEESCQGKIGLGNENDGFADQKLKRIEEWGFLLVEETKETRT